MITNIESETDQYADLGKMKVKSKREDFRVGLAARFWCK